MCQGVGSRGMPVATGGGGGGGGGGLRPAALHLKFSITLQEKTSHYKIVILHRYSR